ncbi:MAG: hypothetical protein DRK00_07405 [Thermoprotei archaeon]|nr:MAG: hypothetical protein DRK00_07405 [Thermoprotei archaeon]
MQVLVRLDEETYAELEKLSKSLGVSKAEIMRRALREYLAKRGSATKSMKGLVKSRLSLRELEEIYWVHRS